jgi:tRNA(fMet)-specific endonuclease VapC
MPEVYMLDTDVCSYIIKHRPPDLKETFLEHKNDTLCISSVTYAELLYGLLLYGLEKNPSERPERDITEFVSLVHVVDWNHVAAGKYAKIRHAMMKKGNVIGSLDMQIAAAAMAADAQLVTNNKKHFGSIEGLKIADWI